MIVRYKGDGTNRLLSGFWGTLGTENPYAHSAGLFFDDFTSGAENSTTATEYYTGAAVYKCLSDGTISCPDLTDLTHEDAFGIHRHATGTTADDEDVIQTPGAMVQLGDATAGGNREVFFEARFRVSSIAASVPSWFIGLTDPTKATAAALLTDANPPVFVTSLNYLGFNVLAGTPSTCNAISANDADSALTAQVSGIQTIVANTWYKMGFWYDGTDVRWYVNGVQNATKTPLSTATMPDAGDWLAPLLIAKSNTTTSFNFDLDWWAVGSRYASNER